MQLADESGMSDNDARVVKRIAAKTVAEFCDEMRAPMQETMRKLIEKIEREIDELSPSQAAIVLGILHDKHGAEVKTVNQALHIHIKGGDSGSALKAILGPQANSIFNNAPAQSNKAPNYLEPVDVTATDATTTRTSDSKSPAPKP